MPSSTMTIEITAAMTGRRMKKYFASSVVSDFGLRSSVTS